MTTPTKVGTIAFTVASATPTQVLAAPADGVLRRVNVTYRNTHASLNMVVTASDDLGLVFAGQAAAGAHVSTSIFTLVPLTTETGPLIVNVVGGPTAQVHVTYVDHPKPDGFAAEAIVMTDTFKPVSICSPPDGRAAVFLDLARCLAGGLNQSPLQVVNNDQPGSAPQTQVRLTRAGTQYVHTNIQSGAPSRVQLGGSYNNVFLPGDLFETRCTTPPQFAGTIVTRWYVQQFPI